MCNMDHPAYHGPISKQRCEELLSKERKDGTYLIRDSETLQGALCLCVYKQKVVYTYRILQTHTGHFTVQTSSGVEEKFFKSLKDLIHNYKQRNQGLATHLRHSLKRKMLQEQPQLCPEPIVPDEENDYENVNRSGEYVVFLPD
ncbi:SH2 domain-containing protein 1B-like [Myxocyprinus asiaticus]|uniref:SH2 domain-containing protein 1B-like n=1 Tax=Myxocyprinus asiaticus TaxID=70543 RepID=UPI0022215A6A|nr:SH2 domain-containing protein 1B-like [Myxocyprinus asiaticus]